MAAGYFFCHDPKMMDQIFGEIRNDGLYISTCGDHKVQYVRDLTTGFDNSKPNSKAVLPVSGAAHMITFTFENGCVATFRGSGTEPKLKYYIEVANTSNEQLATDLLESMKQEILDRFLQPSQNGLRPPASEDSW
jgi:phosphomannomutase